MTCGWIISFGGCYHCINIVHLETQNLNEFSLNVNFHVISDVCHTIFRSFQILVANVPCRCLLLLFVWDNQLILRCIFATWYKQPSNDWRFKNHTIYVCSRNANLKWLFYMRKRFKFKCDPCFTIGGVYFHEFTL